MNKYLIILLGAISCLSSIQAEEAHAQDIDWIKGEGEEYAKSLKSDYNNNKFKDFLDKIDEYFLKSMKEGQFDEVIKSLKENFAKFKEYYLSPDSKMKQMEKTLFDLEQEKCQKLLELSEKYPNLSLSKLLKSIVERQNSISEEKKALDFFTNLEFGIYPHEISFAKEMDQICLEYRVKNDLISTAIYLKTPKLDEIGLDKKENLVSYHHALNFQKLEKLLKLAEKEGDKEMTAFIQKGISKIYPNYMAQSADYLSCNFLIEEYGRSEDPTIVAMGNKTKEILTEYREKYNKQIEENQPDLE